MRPAPKKKATAKLRSWRVSIIRKHGQYLGTVEAPNEKAAEAAAIAEFDLSDGSSSRSAPNRHSEPQPASVVSTEIAENSLHRHDRDGQTEE
jgi:hypothetical protein